MEFVPDITTLIAFSAASVVLAITPGPDMTLQISRALSNGRLVAFACGLGAMAGIAVHTFLVALGVSALVVASPLAFLFLKAGGAGYLLWLAFHAIRKGSSLNIRVNGKSERSLFSNFLQGLGVNLLNPKVILFFMTFLPQFVAVSDPNITGKLIFLGFLFIVESMPIMLAIVLGAHGLSNWLKSRPSVMRTVDYVFASVFSAFAVRILMAQTR